MAEFLLELRSEEIPARMQATAANDLKRLVLAGLKEAGLIFETADCYATPRRLTVVIEGLPTEQPDTREERKGPKVDAPEKAIEGFLKSVGLKSSRSFTILMRLLSSDDKRVPQVRAFPRHARDKQMQYTNHHWHPWPAGECRWQYPLPAGAHRLCPHPRSQDYSFCRWRKCDCRR